MICSICNKNISDNAHLGMHVKKYHNMSSKEYYDLFVKTDTEGVCTCGNHTGFISFSQGYRKYCSPSCASKGSQEKREQTNLIRYGTRNPAQSDKIRSKISDTVKSVECQTKTKQTCLERYKTEYVNQSDIVKQKTKQSLASIDTSQVSIKSHITRNIKSELYEINNNCTRIGKLINQYGQGWLSIKDQLHITHISGNSYVDNKDIPLIVEYVNSSIQSKKEQELINILAQYNPICHSRSIIKPFELDIYIPDKNIAIEYNGNWYHCIENNMSKDYHLNKSLLCRDKNIRLIHIYEFEDFTKQSNLLLKLLNNNDLYPKNDFNKNNLIDHIPEPVIIYQNRYTIYGAGKLF